MSAEVKAAVQKPESYTISQIIIDFTIADLASFSWDMSTVPGVSVSTAAKQDAGVKAMIKGFVEAHIGT